MPTSRGYEQVQDPAEQLAYRLLIVHGSDPKRASRPEHGWANEVWLGETAAVRIKRAVDGGLAREVAIAMALPSDVGYPKVLGLGRTDGLEWMVTERLPGENLKSAWPTLDESKRVKAATNLWGRLEAVHRADVATARTIGCTATPFYALHEPDAWRLLDWVLQNGGRANIAPPARRHAAPDVSSHSRCAHRRQSHRCGSPQHSLGRHERHSDRLRGSVSGTGRP